MPTTAKPGLRELVGREVRKVLLCLRRTREADNTVDFCEGLTSAELWLRELARTIAPELTPRSPIEELEMEAVLTNALKRRGLHTIADLTDQTRATLATIPNLSAYRICMIETALCRNNFGLRGRKGRPRPLKETTTCQTTIDWEAIEGPRVVAMAA